VLAYIVHRQQQGIVRPDGTRRADVSNAEINRELQALKHCFTLAIKHGKLFAMPHIELLAEAPPRSGFVDRAQLEAICQHLTPPIAAVAWFAFITGWRIDSEVLPLEWRQVDFAAGTVRLDPGTTKNGEARTFRMTHDLRALLEARQREREALQAQGLLCPWVFFRLVAKGRRGPKQPKPIASFLKGWRAACAAAGYPGRIPHDLRRSAIRSFVRAGIPDGVAMKLSGHKTRSVFDRYNIVSESDLVDAAARLNRADRDSPLTVSAGDDDRAARVVKIS
jgi:integrase